MGARPRGLVAMASSLIWMGLAGALAAGAHARGARAASRPDVTERIGGSTIGRPIASGFVGLGMEYRAVTAYAGRNPRAVNPVFTQLIRNLAPGQLPVLRIGGDSTDWTWWPIPDRRRPAGVSFSLTPRWLATTRALARETDARMILGINLEADSSAVASAEARALVAGIGRRHVQALEIGNEPELYAGLPWNHTPSGRPVLGRPPSYDFNAFSGEFARLSRALPRVPLAGPATGNIEWLSGLAPFLSAEPALREVTFHRYALNRCVQNRGALSYPTVPNLLTRFASRGLMSGTAPYIAIAHHHGAAFRVDEMNSVTCGGTWGVSNTFASALWILDAMFAIAGSGADGVNIQSSPFPGAPNELFTFRLRRGQWLGSVRPEYYGLLMFTRAAPPGSRLLPVAAAPSAPIRSWATLTPGRGINVVLINDSLTRARSVRVRAPERAGPATLQRLEAPSPYATTGVTIAGQSFDPRSMTGALRGSASTPVVDPIAGAYTVRLPAGSAVMLAIPAPGRSLTPRS